MSMITLQSSSELEVTILSNCFIDNYMPKANGEFVKVYIYLLRTLGGAEVSFSPEHMADSLLCTERDILRALKYWEKENLLTLHMGSDKKISGIVMHAPLDAGSRAGGGSSAQEHGRDSSWQDDIARGSSTQVHSGDNSWQNDIAGGSSTQVHGGDNSWQNDIAGGSSAQVHGGDNSWQNDIAGGSSAQVHGGDNSWQNDVAGGSSAQAKGDDVWQMDGGSARAANRLNGFGNPGSAQMKQPTAAPADTNQTTAPAAGRAHPADAGSGPDHMDDLPSSAKYTLTPDRMKELKQSEDVIQLLYIAEQYLGKTLTPTEMQKILFFYDELKMSTDLIDYLIEYCVGRNHKSMRYIETVALAWAREGITTVNMAKDASSRYGKEYYTILKAMGISNRNPVDTEIALMDTWMKDYGFTMDIIQEACSRTVLQTGQSSFQYADKILSGWKKKRVKNLEDIRVLDAEHKKRKLEKSASRTAAPKTPNRFNNFHQREYDFDEYEKKLLNQ